MNGASVRTSARPSARSRASPATANSAPTMPKTAPEAPAVGTANSDTLTPKPNTPAAT